MKRSATSNHEMTGMTFVEAARTVTRVWRKQRRSEPVPQMSHALSEQDAGTWRICCAETGKEIAVISGNIVALIEEDY